MSRKNVITVIRYSDGNCENSVGTYTTYGRFINIDMALECVLNEINDEERKTSTPEPRKRKLVN